MAFEWCCRALPCFGETGSGDGLNFYLTEMGLRVAIIDVLGHGPESATLARAMEAYLSEQTSNDPIRILQSMHDYFAGSLGAAVTLVYFNTQTLRFSGVSVGNTLLRKCTDAWLSYPALPGIVGEMIPTLRVFEDTFAAGDRFLLTTDGIKENLDPLECLSAQHKSLPYFASFLIEHFSKTYDDATVIVLEYTHG